MLTVGGGALQQENYWQRHFISLGLFSLSSHPLVPLSFFLPVHATSLSPPTLSPPALASCTRSFLCSLSLSLSPSPSWALTGPLASHISLSPPRPPFARVKTFPLALSVAGVQSGQSARNEQVMGSAGVRRDHYSVGGCGFTTHCSAALC